MRFTRALSVVALVVTSGSCTKTETIFGTNSKKAASVTIAFDSTQLTVGNKAKATATVLDDVGAAIPDPAIAWISGDTVRAKVSSTGEVTAVGEGKALIWAAVDGLTANKALNILNKLGIGDLAFHDFDDGTLGPVYTNPYAADLDFVDDPGATGRGKVVRLHYVGNNQDRNRALMYQKRVGLGDSIFMRGELYLPSTIGPGPVQRKLLYWQRELSNGFPEFSTVLQVFGTGLRVASAYVPVNGVVVETVSPFFITLETNKWYGIELFVKLNSTFSATDGVVRVWVDGTLMYEKTNMTWSDPAWPNPQAHQAFAFYEVGTQVNSSGSFDEYRFWNNVTFSKKRIGP